MKTTHLLLAVLLSLGISLFMFHGVNAADPVLEDSLTAICDDAPDSAVCNINYDQTESSNFLVGPNGILTRFTQVMIWFSGTLALIMMIIAGLMFMFSSGNAESAGKAKRTMLYAVIGMIVAVVGQVIVTFVLEKL